MKTKPGTSKVTDAERRVALADWFRERREKREAEERRKRFDEERFFAPSDEVEEGGASDVF